MATKVRRNNCLPTEAELEAWLLRMEGSITNGKKLTRVGVDEAGRTLWQFIPVGYTAKIPWNS